MKKIDLSKLRKVAEEILVKRGGDTGELSNKEAQHLVHELRTHQIELELQNEELRQNQEALLVSQKKYTDLYDFAPVGYLTVSDTGLISKANLKAARMLACERKRLLQRPLTFFFNPEEQDSHYHCRNRLLATKEEQTCERRLQRADSGYLEVQCRCVVDSELDGDGGQFRLVMTDISERKSAQRERIRLESRLQQARKMEAIGTLVGGIAHDFNNLLAIINGYVELIQFEVAPESSVGRQLKKVLIAGVRAANLVKQLLIYSRKAGMGKHHLRLHLMVKEVLNNLRPLLPTLISIEENLDPHCRPILADSDHIHQLILNLITNATQAMSEEKGTLRISLRNRELGAAEIPPGRKLSPGPFVVLSVSDTGCGMEPDIVERIFEPYFTTRKMGTEAGVGLGLAICHGIIEECGGFIEVESHVGKGTDFCIFLPAYEEE